MKQTKIFLYISDIFVAEGEKKNDVGINGNCKMHSEQNEKKIREFNVERFLVISSHDTVI